MATLVYSPQAFADDLARVIRASQHARTVRACLLATRDRDHALSTLKETISACNRPLYHFTVAGRRRYNPNQLKWEVVGGDSADAAGLLRHAQELRGGGVVVLEDRVAFLRDEGGDQRMRMLLAQMLSSETASEGLVLVFVESPEAERHLPSILADQFVRLDVPYPRAEELEGIAREEIALPPVAEAGGLANAAFRGAARSSTRAFRRSAAKTLRRDLLRDRATPVRLIAKDRTVFQYTTKAQARQELQRGIRPGSHMTARATTGRPPSPVQARRRYGLPQQPEVRETIRLTKGYPVRPNRVVGGIVGVGEVTSTRRVPSAAVVKVVPLR